MCLSASKMQDMFMATSVGCVSNRNGCVGFHLKKLKSTVVDLNQQKRLKGGTGNPKLEVNILSLSDDDIWKKAMF